MGKPTKKNIRRKNRRTRRKVNKKKMKKGKGGDAWGINIKLGLCNRDEKATIITYNNDPITGKFINETGQELPTLKKICQNKATPNTITFLINDGQYKRMTHEEFKDKYIYYKPLNEEKFKYDIHIDIHGAITLSKKPFISNMTKPFSSMFSIFKKKK